MPVRLTSSLLSLDCGRRWNPEKKTEGMRLGGLQERKKDGEVGWVGVENRAEGEAKDGRKRSGERGDWEDLESCKEVEGGKMARSHDGRENEGKRR